MVKTPWEILPNSLSIKSSIELLKKKNLSIELFVKKRLSNDILNFIFKIKYRFFFEGKLSIVLCLKKYKIHFSILLLPMSLNIVKQN